MNNAKKLNYSSLGLTHLFWLLIKVPVFCRMVRDGYFGFKDYFKSLCDSLEDGKDFYLLGADFSSYLEAQVIFYIQHCTMFFDFCLRLMAFHWVKATADREFVNQDKWTFMSILSTAGSGRFSSDRTMEEYAKQSWGIEPCKCPF